MPVRAASTATDGAIGGSHAKGEAWWCACGVRRITRPPLAGSLASDGVGVALRAARVFSHLARARLFGRGEPINGIRGRTAMQGKIDAIAAARPDRLAALETSGQFFWVAMFALMGLLLSVVVVTVTQDWSQPVQFTGLE